MFHTDYESIERPIKEPKGSLARGLAFGFSAAVLLVLSTYFLYSGYNGHQIPLISYFTSDEAHNVRIEYYMDDERAQDLVPGTTQWIAFHDALIEEAGYDAESLRSNPTATVTFVAYDAEEAEEQSIVDADIADEEIDEEMRKKKRSGGGSGNFYKQKRPTFGISCYTEYTEIGDTNKNMCNPTRKISNPIRTGCSSLGSASDELSGVSPMNELECASSSPDERVSARCCQPTPKTDYVSSEWTMTPREKRMGNACLSAGCHENEILTGCTGAQMGSALGGTKYFKNECNVQKNGFDGTLSVKAMCAKQSMKPDYMLDCQAVNAEGAEMMGGAYVSTAQCPVDYVMFDCSSFLDDQIGECSGKEIASDAQLFGEFYYKEKVRSKTFCKAMGATDSTRAQAVCCGLF